MRSSSSQFLFVVVFKLILQLLKVRSFTHDLAGSFHSECGKSNAMLARGGFFFAVGEWSGSGF